MVLLLLLLDANDKVAAAMVGPAKVGSALLLLLLDANDSDDNDSILLLLLLLLLDANERMMQLQLQSESVVVWDSNRMSYRITSSS